MSFNSLPTPIADLTCQDNAASTVVIDHEAAGNGVLTNAGNTADIDEAGPHGWLPSALSLDGTDDWVFINSPSGVITAGEFTMECWVKGNVTWSDKAIVGSVAGADTGVKGHTDTAIRIYVNNASDEFAVPSLGTTFHHVVATRDASDNGRVYVDGVESVTGSLALGSESVNWAAIGRVDSFYPNADFAGVRIRDVALTADQVLDAFNGPEPTYISGGSLAANGDFDAGTWGLPSPYDGLAADANGALSYVSQLRDADDVVLDTVNSNTGTFTMLATPGQYRLFVRASNNGGYDETAGDDGFVELASVTIGASGTAASTLAALTQAAAGSATPPIIGPTVHSVTRPIIVHEVTAAQ